MSDVETAAEIKTLMAQIAAMAGANHKVGDDATKAVSVARHYREARKYQRLNGVAREAAIAAEASLMLAVLVMAPGRPVRAAGKISVPDMPAERQRAVARLLRESKTTIEDLTFDVSARGALRPVRPKPPGRSTSSKKRK